MGFERRTLKCVTVKNILLHKRKNIKFALEPFINEPYSDKYNEDRACLTMGETGGSKERILFNDHERPMSTMGR